MHRIAFAIAAILSIFIASPSWAQGEILITQAKALAGNVTPGDTAGYPVTISQPGAYMLASNLIVPNGIHGLFVTANNVDIDMNGFLLTGNGGGTYGLISGYGESRIHGGVINRFRHSGIYLRNNAWVIEDMQIVRNGGSGIDAAGARFTTVQKSLIAANGRAGIISGQNSMVRNNTISSNQSEGIDCAGTCHVEANAIDGNASHGVQIASGMVIGNTISNNVEVGIVEFTPFDTGVAHNTLINNNPNGTEQIFGGIDAHPNACIGKPC